MKGRSRVRSQLGSTSHRQGKYKNSRQRMELEHKPRSAIGDQNQSQEATWVRTKNNQDGVLVLSH